MHPALLRILVPGLFRVKSRQLICREIRGLLAEYHTLAEQLGPDACSTPVRVPSMLGVDEDMRDWSLAMILEHNAIVNRTMRLIVRSLAHGKAPRSLGRFDMKADVMPSANPGAEQIAAHRESIKDYLRVVEKLPRLRGTPKQLHPIFGPLDAHGWHAVFALHLKIHLKQARELAKALTNPPPFSTT